MVMVTVVVELDQKQQVIVTLCDSLSHLQTTSSKELTHWKIFFPIWIQLSLFDSIFTSPILFPPMQLTMSNRPVSQMQVPLAACHCCTTSWDRPNLEIWATTTWNSKLSYAISRLTCDWYRHLTATQRILALGLSSAVTEASYLRNIFNGTLWHRDIHRCIKWCGIVELGIL